jgi:hypothetical protein
MTASFQVTPFGAEAADPLGLAISLHEWAKLGSAIDLSERPAFGQSADSAFGSNVGFAFCGRTAEAGLQLVQSCSIRS